MKSVEKGVLRCRTVLNSGSISCSNMNEFFAFQAKFIITECLGLHYIYTKLHFLKSSSLFRIRSL